jgi:hypothetical protein
VPERGVQVLELAVVEGHQVDHVRPRVRLFLALVAAEQELHHVRLAGLQVVVEVLRRRRVGSIHLERRSGPWCSSSPRKFWCAGGGPLWGEAALAGLGKHF